MTPVAEASAHVEPAEAEAALKSEVACEEENKKDEAAAGAEARVATGTRLSAEAKVDGVHETIKQSELDDETEVAPIAEVPLETVKGLEVEVATDAEMTADADVAVKAAETDVQSTVGAEKAVSDEVAPEVPADTEAPPKLKAVDASERSGVCCTRSSTPPLPTLRPRPPTTKKFTPEIFGAVAPHTSALMKGSHELRGQNRRGC